MGVQCWLDSNFFLNQLCESSPLEIVAHSPQTGLVLIASHEHFNFVNLEMEGDRGQMTNQDLGKWFIIRNLPIFWAGLFILTHNFNTKLF